MPQCHQRSAASLRKSCGERIFDGWLKTYDGGHGWRGNVYGDIRDGVEWLEANRPR